MDNELTTKRSLVLILVVAAAVIFISLVWLIATLDPWNLLTSAGPSSTAGSSMVDKNCTYPVYFWKEHPELYPAQIVIGNDIYQPKEIASVLADASEDPVNQLKVQLVGAFLNIASGADESSIEVTIFQAYGWLVRNPAGTDLSDSEHEAGTRLLDLLVAYNMGLTGIAPCEPGLPQYSTQPSTATETSTLQVTPSPSETPTTTPSETPTPIEYTATATYEFIQPTRAATRTTAPTIQLPTNTAVQPTEQPASTDTPKPPNTPTTAPPPPTPTLQPPTPTLPPPTPTLPLPIPTLP
jgi:hypothetical protein